ncbi:uncharacterized protein LOC126679121 [Mercurialis annua]|uniref:uncharacterized protein LOC126679121 n=1 Tax=Mercurialis annua TaxID=3986 RepID=UPI00216074A8|nr:uncharacterized protein LOC126679121 [Mercurialis annua]
MANCKNDTQIPVRSSYIDIHKWPKSDSFRRPDVHGNMAQAKVVDSRSCRQMYLRSYTFSRKESVQEKTKKRFDEVRERIKNIRSRKRSSSSNGTF